MDMNEQLSFFIGCSIVNLPIAKGSKSVLAMGFKIGVHLDGWFSNRKMGVVCL
jgi:hypothetical protein